MFITEFIGIGHAQRAPDGYLGPGQPIVPLIIRTSSPGPAVLLGPNILPNVLVNDRTLPGFTQMEPTVAAFGDIVVSGFMDGPNASIRHGITGWSFSTNGGGAWTDLRTSLPLDNPSDPGTSGDPSLDVDSAGDFYFANLYSRVGVTAGNVSVQV